MRRFAVIARRELFETVLHPNTTEIQLIYTAASSAAAFPGGENFRYQFSSPKGTHLLALSSSRIFVIDLSQPEIRVGRELKISKRPVSAAILDDGSILAVLSSNHHVTLYDLTKEKARYIKSFPLDNEPRTIALSPGAEVLGAAFEGGIEVYSLHADATQMDRRDVMCDTVDSLSFSPDGTILVGTTVNSSSPTTVLVTAQHFSTDMPVEGLAQLWTTQVLFPRSSRDSSHATLLPAYEDSEGAAWTFTYDRVYETFRAVRVEDLRNGHTYFTGPSHETTGLVIPPTALPTSTSDGSLVAAAFNSRLWLYGTPRNLEPPPHPDDPITNQPSRSSSAASPRPWPVISDKHRNVFLHGRHISSHPSLHALKFITGTHRLVLVSNPPSNAPTDFTTTPTSSAYITLHDFTRTPCPSSRTTTIEIGDGVQGPIESLPEHTQNLETEIALARRRTVAFRGNNRNSTAVLPAAIHAPYSHTDPRSTAALHRTRTTQPTHTRYTRVVGPDGLPVMNTPAAPPQQQHAPGWSPPPPPYSPQDENPAPLPPALLWSLQPAPVVAPPVPQVRPRSAWMGLGRRGSVAVHATAPSAPPPVPEQASRAPHRGPSQRSVGRRRSRAGVSAARNVEDARRRRRERESVVEPVVEGSGGSGRFKREKVCVVM